MCGIAAVLGPHAGRQPTTTSHKERALARLAARGPDGGATWTCRSGHAWLGHRRLIVVDPSERATQPFVDAEGQCALTCNGEIYNAPSLRRDLEAAGARFASQSDNEVLLHGYRLWGERELLRRAEGMFAFVIWDAARARAVLAVDHAGMKPLYFARRCDLLYVASDADALRALLGAPQDLDADGLAHILTLGYCPAPGTLWRGIEKLGPGRGLVFDAHSAQMSAFRHWEAPRTATTPWSDEAFADIWHSVIREQVRADVPTGLLLSAGIDSTALAIAAARETGSAPTFMATTLSLPGENDEAPVAALTASSLGLRHQTRSIAASDSGELLAAAAHAFDETQAYGAVLTMCQVARAAREHSTVVLTGDGGDEAFAGYTWQHGHANARTLGLPQQRLGDAVAHPDAPSELRHYALTALGERSYVHGHLQRVFPRFHPSEARSLLAPLGSSYDEERYAAWLSAEDAPDLPEPRRAQRLDLSGFCAGSILPKVDRATMAVGLEARCPFLDRRILDYALSTTPRASHESKAALRRYVEGHAPHKAQQHVRKHVLQRSKQGFSLRLGEGVWRRRIDWLRQTRFIKSGMLHPRWEAFVAADTPSSDARVFALCMIAAWAEERL